jgi:hypothetical protein
MQHPKTFPVTRQAQIGNSAQRPRFKGSKLGFLRGRARNLLTDRGFRRQSDGTVKNGFGKTAKDGL